MRYVLLAILAAALLALPARAQVGKKKNSKTDTPPEMKEKKGKETKGTPSQPPEITEIAGKTIEQWTRAIHSKDPSRRAAAIRTILGFNSKRAYKAVPALIEELKKHRPGYPVDLSVRVTGAEVLATILSNTKDPDAKHVRDAVAILRGFLKDSQAIVRVRALQALPKLGPAARAALPEVKKLVRDPDTYEVRVAALLTLVPLAHEAKGPPAPDVLQTIYTALNKDREHAAQVRYTALKALASLGVPGDLAQKAPIIRYLDSIAERDPDPSVQLWAHMALMTVKQSVTTEHLNPVARFLKHDDVVVRIQAAQALSMARTLGRPVAGSVLQGLEDTDPNVVVNCIIALVSMEDFAAIPTLQKIKNDPAQKNEMIKRIAGDAVEELQRIQKNDGKKKGDEKKKKK